MKPTTTIRKAASRALRRRYGYAAMRTLRRAVRAALHHHTFAQHAPRRYSTTTEEIHDAYRVALQRVRKKFPRLDLSDPRGQP